MVKGKATDRHVLTRTIREIEMSGNWFGCVRLRERNGVFDVGEMRG